MITLGYLHIYMLTFCYTYVRTGLSRYKEDACDLGVEEEALYDRIDLAVQINYL